MNNLSFQRIIRQLEERLALINTGEENWKEKILASINECAGAFNELKAVVSNEGLSSMEEEICFFRQVKPLVYGKLLYFLDLYFYEAGKPLSGESLLKEHLLKTRQKLLNYLDDHREFYSYYRSGSDLFDRHYFVRGQIDVFLTSRNVRALTNPEFNTSHDHILSRVKATEMMLQYLEKEKSSLAGSFHASGTTQNPGRETHLNWTGSKVALVELIYALHAACCINNGNADIKAIAERMSGLFGADLGDFYRTFLEIRERKIKRTKFLDILREALIARMDEADA